MKSSKNDLQEAHIIVRPRDPEVIPPPDAESFKLIQSDEEKERIVRLIDSNLAGQKLPVLKFPKITAPASGSDRFTVDGSAGNASERELLGVIVAFRQARQYWVTEFGKGDGNKPPDCSSEDGFVGILKPDVQWKAGKPTGDCTTCPFAVWGSAPNNAQACQDRRWLLVLLADQILPHFFNLPPTSSMNFMQYVHNLTSEGLDYWSVVTRIVPEPYKSGGGVKYSRARFWKHRTLSREQAQRIQPFHQRMVGFLKPMTVEASLASSDEPVPF